MIKQGKSDEEIKKDIISKYPMLDQAAAASCVANQRKGVKSEEVLQGLPMTPKEMDEKGDKVLSKEEAEQMAKDAGHMDQDSWCNKYPIGDYGQYKKIWNNRAGTSEGGSEIADFQIIAHSIPDKDTAQRVADTHNGAVVADEKDPKKFMIIMRESKINEIRFMILDLADKRILTKSSGQILDFANQAQARDYITRVIGMPSRYEIVVCTNSGMKRPEMAMAGAGTERRVDETAMKAAIKEEEPDASDEIINQIFANQVKLGTEIIYIKSKEDDEQKTTLEKPVDQQKPAKESKTSKGHYGDYMGLLGGFKDKVTMLAMAMACKRAGADIEGVNSAIGILTGRSFEANENAKGFVIWDKKECKVLGAGAPEKDTIFPSKEAAEQHIKNKLGGDNARYQVKPEFASESTSEMAEGLPKLAQEYNASLSELQKMYDSAKALRLRSTNKAADAELDSADKSFIINVVRHRLAMRKKSGEK